MVQVLYYIPNPEISDAEFRVISRHGVSPVEPLKKECPGV